MQRSNPRNLTLYSAAAVGILLLTFALRIGALNTLPPGLSSDEAASAIDGLQISRYGSYPLYEDFGRPDPLYEVLLSVSVLLFGPGVFVMRYMSVLVGLLTVAAACWTMRQCLPDHALGVRWLAGLAAAAVLAIGLSHITLSRSVYRGIVQPLFFLLFIGWTLRGLSRSQRPDQTHPLLDFALAGISLGMALYTYTAAFSAPASVAALACSLICFRRRNWRRWLPGLVALGVALMVTAGVLEARIATTPGSIFGRAGDVSKTAATSLEGRVSEFVGGFFTHGDGNPQYNSDSAPLLPPVFNALFALGLLGLLIRFRHPSTALIGALLILAALPVLATDEVPHGLRIAGEFAVYPLITGLAAAMLYRASPKLRWTVPLGLIAITLVTGALAWNAYNGYWQQPLIAHVYGRDLSIGDWFFRPDRRDFADWLSAQSAPLLVPVDELDTTTTRAWLMTRYPEVRAVDPGDNGAFQLPADTRVVIPWSLELGDLRRQTRLFALLNRGVITMLPPLSFGAQADLLANIDAADAVRRTNGDLLARVRPVTTPITFEPRVTSTNGPFAVFDHAIQLDSWHGPQTLLSTSDPQHVVYTLDWQVQHPTAHYYSAFVQLQTQDSKRIAGDDVLILRWLFPAMLWQPSDVVPNLHALDIPPNLPPGAYRLVAGLYVFVTQRTAATDGQGQPLGDSPTFGWIKVPQPAIPAVPLEARSIDATVGGQFALRAASIRIADGGHVTVSLYWQALVDRPALDATIFVHVVNTAGTLIAQQDARPWNGQYPTFIWDKGETVQTDSELVAPTGSLNGLRLQIGLYTFPSLARLSVIQNGAPAPDNVIDLPLAAPVF